MSLLYAKVALATTDEVRKWQSADVQKVAEQLSQGWKEWTRVHRRLVECEVGEMIAQALKDDAPGATVYRALVTKDKDDEHTWHFDHDGKILGPTGRKFSGMVIVVSLGGDADDAFCRLGVIENNDRVTLSHEIKEHAIPSGDSHAIPIKFKVLTSIVSQARQHLACSVDAPPFATQLMGRPFAPTKVEYKPAPRDSRLNDDQEKAVQYWIGRKGAVPPFMLLQGPPGTGMLPVPLPPQPDRKCPPTPHPSPTGKTTTAVEMVRRSLSWEGAHLGVKKEKKIVCAAPTWAAVYQYAERFLDAKDKNKSIRVAMTGRNDGKRRTVMEPEALRPISVVTLIQDIQAWVDSEDRTYQGYKSLMKRIGDGAPVFYSTEDSQLSKENELVEDLPSNLEMRCGALGYEFQNKLKVAMLKEATVIFTTLNALGGKAFVGLPKHCVGTLIVDEAGQATDTDLFIGCRLSSDRLLLLGDHRQLPPTARSDGAKKGGLACSSLERLYERGDEDAPHKRMLTVQYRMPPEVVEWPNAMFYNGLLKTAKEASGDREGKPPPYRVIDVQFGEGATVGKSTSLQNPAEAACVTRVVCQLRSSYGLGADLRDVMIITPYAAQRDLLQRHLVNCFGDVPRERLPTVSTIDGCQGAEREHVVLSLVRTNRQKVNSFATCPKHLCVALTRAKETMTVVCHAEGLRIQSPKCAKLLLQHSKARPGCWEVLPRHCMTSHRGTIVGKRFVAEDKSGVVVQVGDLGYKVFHGDEVTLRLLDDTLGGKLVVDVKVEKEAAGRKEDIVCQIVNDRHVCFYAPHREDRGEILREVRALAQQAAGHLCNGATVVIGERQPVDENYFTLAVADKLFAEKLMTGVTVVRIPDADADSSEEGKMKKVPASLPQEPYYHNFVPIDDRFPDLRVDSRPVRELGLTYKSVVRVRLILDSERVRHPSRDEFWFADIRELPEPLGVENLLLESVGVDVEHEHEEPAQARVHAEEPVQEGGAFSIHQEGTRVFDNAVSCRKSGSGWEVTLYVADPSADDDLQKRLSEQLVDIRSMNKTTRLWPVGKLDGASLRRGEARRCLCVTFGVTSKGGVSKTGWTMQAPTIVRNFLVLPRLSWESFVTEHQPGQGPLLMGQAVGAMMQRTRYLEEATRTDRELRGPAHLMHYLVLCAKRAAAYALRPAGGVLFANARPALDEARRVLRSIGADVGNATERALCVAFDKQLPTLFGRSVKAAAAAASVRHSNRAMELERWSAEYVADVSVVSFTDPLHRFNDFYVLQQLKKACGFGGPAHPATPVVLHQRKLDELRRDRINRELKEARAPRTGVTQAMVTQVEHDRVSLFCDATDSLIEVLAKNLEKDAAKNATPFVTMYTACAVRGNRKTFMRHQRHHVVPYSKPEKIIGGMQVAGAKKRRAAPREKKPERRKPIEVWFAGEPPREKLARSMEDVHAAMVTMLQPYANLASCLRLPILGLTDRKWRYFCKKKVCPHRNSCRHGDRCNFIHPVRGVKPEELFKQHFDVLRKAAQDVSEDLSCVIVIRAPEVAATKAPEKVVRKKAEVLDAMVKKIQPDLALCLNLQRGMDGKWRFHVKKADCLQNGGSDALERAAKEVSEELSCQVVVLTLDRIAASACTTASPKTATDTWASRLARN